MPIHRDTAAATHIDLTTKPMTKHLQHIGLIVKGVPEAVQTGDRLEAWLRDRGRRVVRLTNGDQGLTFEKRQAHMPDLACVFVLGGDGTLLSAARWLGRASVPILGVKFGEVGFLAETAADDLFEAAEAVLDGRYQIQKRMRLAVSVIREGHLLERESVLNDVVLTKGTLARLAHIPTHINDHYLTTFRADGLIVSTPTGSTAYSLAAGGPVIHPEVPGIILTPICPFTLTNRPLVLPDNATIRMEVGSRATDMVLTMDGQAGLEIRQGDAVVVNKSPHPVHMIQIPGSAYYDVLKAKLSWSGGRA